MYAQLETLVQRYPALQHCATEIARAIDVLADAFRRGGKLLVCGNGGSAADSEHIVGELMKNFHVRRPLAPDVQKRLVAMYADEGAYLAGRLQGALPALALTSQVALTLAISNDIAGEMVFAQQVYGYGRAGDVVLGISTSGTSRNVCHALRVGRALRMHTIGLTGENGGAFPQLCDVTIRVPARTVDQIQELHLPVYHAICATLEELFF
ncbi:MAG: SIS domain-containing protein [Ktedonobacteraceae bacterium]|nr:SIS domain-containing protein [Ktedonobacteraceae bacterium]